MRGGGGGTASYIKFSIFALLKQGLFLRLCGIFNEPGALGTLCAFIFIGTYEYSTKKEKAVLLISLFLTFSMAGYIFVFIFWGFQLFSKNHKNLLWLIPLFLVLFVAPNINWTNDNINHLIERMSFTANGLYGDNRTNVLFDGLYDSFIKTKDVWFGLGYRAALTANDGSSYKNLIVQFGYLGTGALIIGFIYSYLKISKFNRSKLLLLLIFIVSLYQRPLAVVNLYSYVILFGSIHWIDCHEESNKTAI